MDGSELLVGGKRSVGYEETILGRNVLSGLRRRASADAWGGQGHGPDRDARRGALRSPCISSGSYAVSASER